MSKPTVILLPGLGAPGWTMAFLANRIEASGYRTATLSYEWRGNDLDAIVGRLKAEVESLRPGDVVHLLGHSFGGLVASLLCDVVPSRRTSRAVAIAAPMRGSALAYNVHKHDPGGNWLGQVGGDLSRIRRARVEAGRPAERAQVAGIAGRVPFLDLVYGKDTDGVIFVEETKLDSMADHIVVDGSHATLLLSPTVARQAVAFLDDGAFLSNVDELGFAAAT